MDTTTNHAPSGETQRPDSPRSSPTSSPRCLGTRLLPTIQERPRRLRRRLVERRQLGRCREETRKGQTLTPPSPPPLPFSLPQPQASPFSSRSLRWTGSEESSPSTRVPQAGPDDLAIDHRQ